MEPFNRAAKIVYSPKICNSPAGGYLMPRLYEKKSGRGGNLLSSLGI